ncbi:YopX family protein [Psychroflexus aestuariivivens]|uniref:YopX family protein n=1 Tax=Psychroflexus aestuariivivens TaxID=1795040 RepID=UPI000FDA23FD|nr:YopX family protein [Psychroflexus aestuariivivens]
MSYELELRGFVHRNCSGQIINQMRYASPFQLYKWKEQGTEISIMLFSGKLDKNNRKIFAGDLHKDETIVDGEMKASYYPIIFEDASFWVDESFKKDGTCLIPLSEYPEPINIQGNIFENPNYKSEG